jgi:hypothetical protein
MVRPKVVTISTWLMAVLNILGYALLWEPHKTRSAVLFLFVAFTFIISAGYVVLWFFWKGKNWARLLVLLNCFVCFYPLHDVHRYLHVNPVERGMLFGNLALALFLLWYLNTREAREFFRPSLARNIPVSRG